MGFETYDSGGEASGGEAPALENSIGCNEGVYSDHGFSFATFLQTHIQIPLDYTPWQLSVFSLTSSCHQQHRGNLDRTEEFSTPLSRSSQGVSGPLRVEKNLKEVTGGFLRMLVNLGFTLDPT